MTIPIANAREVNAGIAHIYEIPVYIKVETPGGSFEEAIAEAIHERLTDLLWMGGLSEGEDYEIEVTSNFYSPERQPEPVE